MVLYLVFWMIDIQPTNQISREVFHSWSFSKALSGSPSWSNLVQSSLAQGSDWDGLDY